MRQSLPCLTIYTVFVCFQLASGEIQCHIVQLTSTISFSALEQCQAAIRNIAGFEDPKGSGHFPKPSDGRSWYECRSQQLETSDPHKLSLHPTR